jgi:hypothetical protein
MPDDAEDTAVAEADNLATTLSEIDRLISDVVAEKDIAIVPSDKKKRIEEASSEDMNFDLRHLDDLQLSEEEFSISTATNLDPCSSAGLMKKLWDAFVNTPG